MKNLDWITLIVVVGCFVTMQFGTIDSAKTAGAILIAVVGHYSGRKLK